MVNYGRKCLPENVSYNIYRERPWAAPLWSRTKLGGSRAEADFFGRSEPGARAQIDTFKCMEPKPPGAFFCLEPTKLGLPEPPKKVAALQHWLWPTFCSGSPR